MGMQEKETQIFEAIKDVVDEHLDDRPSDGVLQEAKLPTASYLANNGKITARVADEALSLRHTVGERPAHFTIPRGRGPLLEGMPDDGKLDFSVIRLIPKKFCKPRGIFPVGVIKNEILLFCVQEPLNEGEVKELEDALNSSRAWVMKTLGWKASKDTKRLGRQICVGWALTHKKAIEDAIHDFSKMISSW